MCVRQAGVVVRLANTSKMKVLRSVWAPHGIRKGATVCEDDQGYFVRYAHTMKTVGESKRYKRLSTAYKKAEQWCEGNDE